MTGAVEAPFSHHHELSGCNPCCERSPGRGTRRENTEILRNVVTRAVVTASVRKRAGVGEGESLHTREATMEEEQQGEGHESREDFKLGNLAEEHSLNGLSSTQVSTASSPSNQDSSQMNHRRHKRRGERQISVPYWGGGQAGGAEEDDESVEADHDDGSVEGDEDDESPAGEEQKEDGGGSQGEDEEGEDEGDSLLSQFWRGKAAAEKKNRRNGQDEEMQGRNSARKVPTRLPVERGEDSTRRQEGGGGSRSDSSDLSEEDDEIEAPRPKRRRRLVVERCPDDSTGENDTEEDQSKGENSQEKEEGSLLSRVSGSGFFYSSQDLPSVACSKDQHHVSTSSLQTSCHTADSVSSSSRPNSDVVSTFSRRPSSSEERQNKSSSVVTSPFSRSRRSPSCAGAAESPPDISRLFPFLSSSLGKQGSDPAMRKIETTSRRGNSSSSPSGTVLSGSGSKTGRGEGLESDRHESEGEEYQEAREQDDDEEEQTQLQSDKTSQETTLKPRRRAAGTSDADSEDSVSESSSGEEEEIDMSPSSRATRTDQEVVNSHASSSSPSSRRSSDSSASHASLHSSACSSSSSDCSSSSSHCSSSSSSPPCASQSSSSSFVSSVFPLRSTVSSSLCSSVSSTKAFSGREVIVGSEGRDEEETSSSSSSVSSSQAKKGGGTLSFLSTFCPSLTRVLSGREGDNEGAGENLSQRRDKEEPGDISEEEKEERQLFSSQRESSMDNVSGSLIGDPSEPVSYRAHVKGEPSSSSSLRHPRRRPSSTSSLRLNVSSGEQSGHDSEGLALVTSGEGGAEMQGEEGRSSSPASLSEESVEGGERGVHTRGRREGEEGRRRGSSGGRGEERQNDSSREGEDEKSGEAGDVEDTGSVLEVVSGNEEEAAAISVDSGDEDDDDDDDVSVVRETSAEGDDGRLRPSSSPPASFLHSNLVRCFRNPNAATFLRSHMQEARGRSGSPRPQDEEGRREGERSGDREQDPGDSLEVIAVEEEEEEEAVEVIRVENQQTTTPASLALAQGYFFPSSFPLSMQPTGYMLPFSPGMMMSAARVPAPVERGEEHANVPRCAICLMNLRRRHEEVLRLMEEQEDHEEKASTNGGGGAQQGQDDRSSSSSSPSKEAGSEGGKDGTDPPSPSHPDESHTGNGESRGGGGDSSSKGGEQEEETTGEQAGGFTGGEDASSSSRSSPPSGQRRGGGGGSRGKGANRRRGGKSDGGTADQKKALTEKFKALYSKDDESQTMVTVCGHAFCQGCLLRALEMKKECPVCRRKLQGPRQFFPVFF